MKRISTLCISILMLFTFAAPAAAQSFDWGIVAGLNLSKVTFSGAPEQNFKSDNKAGWYIGPKIMFNTVIGLGVDASLQYSQRSLFINRGIDDIDGTTEKYHTIEIPINLRYNIGLGKKAGIYIATGPQFGFALNNMAWENLGSGANFDRHNMNTTWNIGAGVRLLNHLEIGVGYNFALSNTGKAIFENFGGHVGESHDYQLKYRTNTAQVQLTYLF